MYHIDLLKVKDYKNCCMCKGMFNDIDLINLKIVLLNQLNKIFIMLILIKVSLNF